MEDIAILRTEQVGEHQMKVILGKHNKATATALKGRKPAVVLDLSLERPTKFKGFSYTVEEGLRLAKRCFTEIPGLVQAKK